MIITVQCPACETRFPVDPRKVPEGGVKVRCSSCSGIFFVDKPELPSVADLAPSPEPEVAGDAAPAAAATEVAAEAAAASARAAAAEEAASAEEAAAAVEEAAAAVGWTDASDPAEPELAEPPVRDWAEALPASAEVHEAPTTPAADATEHSPEEDWATEVPAAAASVDEGGEQAHRADALEESVSDADPWGETDFDDPSEGVHHDHGSPDPWAGGMDLPDAEESLDAVPQEAPAVERLETVEEITRSAMADYPMEEPLDDPDDAWGDPTPAAEAPVTSFDDAGPAASDPGDASAHPVEMGGHVEVAAPPVAAPAPSKFQFGRRDPDEKARRLARVLVSDIITYNPERHQRALEQDTLHADFEDEIRKSWAEYVEQVGRDLAESTSYWFDALNEILARGQKVF
jgi:predicted Zn finger-like uncharacterized protein